MSKSIALPFSIVNGRVASTTNASDQLTNRVYTVLATEIGERVMRPSYGADLNRFNFMAGSNDDQIAMQEEVNRALQQWEPGATVSSVYFTDYVDPYGKITAVIEYFPTNSVGSAAIQQVLIGVLANGSVMESNAPMTADGLLGGATTGPALPISTTRLFGTED